MRFNVIITMINPDYYLPLAQAAEEAGFDSISLADSIAYPKESESKYPYTPDGSREFLEHKPFLDPLIVSAAMAAVTTRVRLQTGVLKLPIRHPVIFAKEATSLAVMTNNRFVLGVGTSPWPDDYELVGLPWARRGRRLEECLEIIRGLSTGEYFEFHGEFYDIPAVKMNPVPTKPIPVMIGGNSKINIDRAARIGDGWYPNEISTSALADITARIHARRRELGRQDRPFEVYATNSDSSSLDGIKRLEDAGVTHTLGGMSAFNPYDRSPDGEPLQDKIDAIRRFGDEVISKVG